MDKEVKEFLEMIHQQSVGGVPSWIWNKAYELLQKEQAKISSNSMLADSLPLSSEREIKTPQLDSWMDRILKALKR